MSNVFSLASREEGERSGNWSFGTHEFCFTLCLFCFAQSHFSLSLLLRAQGSEDGNDGQSALWSVGSNHCGAVVCMKRQSFKYLVFLEKKPALFGECLLTFLSETI